MTQLELHSDPARIDAAWLTKMLNAAGIEGTVNSFSAKSIGTGQVGENVRFTLEGPGDLPQTIVGKFPSPDPVSKQTGIEMNNYRREVYFYQELASKVNVQVPKVYHADVNNETHDFVLIMEDLAPGEQGDQLGGCSIDSAMLAMEQLAHLQGPVWGDDSLIHEFVSDRQTEPEVMNGLYDMLAGGFIDRYADRLIDEEKEMVNLVGDNLVNYMMGYTGKQTLIHIDYRLDNMMFGGPYPLAVVDWQSVAFGCPLTDASYFTGTSLTPDTRRANDENLLRHYFDTLHKYDVELTWDDCWKHYCCQAPAGLIMAVIASMIVGETERGNDMFMVMAKRSARMCRDLNTINQIASTS